VTNDVTNDVTNEGTITLTEDTTNDVTNEDVINEEIAKKDQMKEIDLIRDVQEESANIVNSEGQYSNDIDDNKLILSLAKKEDEIDELKLDSNDLEESNINIKFPESEHIELYKAALQKAKTLRKQALQKHLEAQNIKAKYLLNVYSDSDSDYSEYENESII
jgi:D-alanyl-D-alanine carboxypeptidase